MKISQEQFKTMRSGFFAGILVGLFLAAINSFAKIDTSSWFMTWIYLPFVLALTVAMLPFCVPYLIKAFKQILFPLGITTIDIKLPGLGSTKLDLANPQRAAARKIFLEMTTRTVTQPLDKDTGTLTAAMSSLYDFFQIVREELKKMPPTPPGTDPKAETLESIAHRMMNEALRPYTSRWHPRLDTWNQTGLVETDWPLHEQCRHDLNRMRSLAIKYANTLGEAAVIPNINTFVPEDPYPELENSQIDPAKKQEFVRIDTLLQNAPSVEHRQIAWKLAVEFYGASATIKKDFSDPDAVQEVLISFDKLAGSLTWNTSMVLPTPGDNDLDELGLKVLTDIEEYRQKFFEKQPVEIEELQKWLKSKGDAFKKIARQGIVVD